MGVVYFSIIPTVEPSRYCKCWIVCFNNKNILQLEKPLEILRAGIIDNEPMLKTPWGDKRLADKAVNK